MVVWDSAKAKKIAKDKMTESSVEPEHWHSLKYECRAILNIIFTFS